MILSSHAWCTCWVDPVVLCGFRWIVGRPSCSRLIRLRWVFRWIVGWRIIGGWCTGGLWQFGAHAHVAFQVGAVGVVPLGGHVVSLNTVLCVVATLENINISIRTIAILATYTAVWFAVQPELEIKWSSINPSKTSISTSGQTNPEV